jgi:hypothetical protein
MLGYLLPWVCVLDKSYDLQFFRLCTSYLTIYMSFVNWIWALLLPSLSALPVYHLCEFEQSVIQTAAGVPGRGNAQEVVTEAQVKFQGPWSEHNSKSSLLECTWQTPQLTDTGISILQPFICQNETPSSKGQEKKDTENWGKLLFQLKQKHPEQGTIVGPFFLWTRCLVSSYWSTRGDSDHGSSNSFSCFV